VPELIKIARNSGQLEPKVRPLSALCQTLQVCRRLMCLTFFS